MELKENLKTLRKQSNMTQEQLAEKLFVSRAAVSKWESGRGYPSIDSLQAITKLFGITLDALLSSEEVLDLAKANTRSDLKKVELRIFGILDILCIALLFLPFFAKKSGDKILSVPLIFCENIPFWQNIVFYCLIALISLVGIAEIITSFLVPKKHFVFLQTASWVISSLMILFFIASNEPYAAAYSFCLMLAKIILIAKNHRK